MRMRSGEPSGKRRAQLEVILGALAFALSVPLSRRLLADIQPLALSAGLYLSAGTVLLLAWAATARGPAGHAASRSVQGREWIWLGVAVVSGAVLGPMALLFGLRQVPGHVAALLLNFEAVFTIALGALWYRECLGRRGWIGALAVVAGAVLLSWRGAGETDGPASRVTGVLLVVAACAFWALDNNVIQRVSLRDARQVVGIKGLAGGTVSLVLAASLGQLGGWTPARAALVVLLGVVCYGVSIMLFVRGLRSLGVVQTGTLFALAPGFAALLSYAILREPLSLSGCGALVVMTAGALWLATDRHEHGHRHEVLEHAHVHEHDEHHQHEHTPEELARTPHDHPHHHAAMTHAHAHVHDAHHRHAH